MTKKDKVSREISAFFSKAGKKSSANMTPEERKERARKAAAKRWEAKK